MARLFGPAIFEASKLKVLFLGVDEEKHPGKLPRTYTLTHSDITSKLTLAISQTINNPQVYNTITQRLNKEYILFIIIIFLCVSFLIFIEFCKQSKEKKILGSSKKRIFGL